MRLGKLLLVSLSAAALLALAVGSASAGLLSLSEREIDIKWRELIFSNNVNTNVLTCAVTLLGTFHNRTIRKTTGLLIGTIEHAVLAERVGVAPKIQERCTGGAATILTATLPWHVRYDSFSGTLPRITLVRVQLVNAAFRINLAADGLTCLVRTDATEPARGNIDINAEGQLGLLTPEGSIRADDATCAFLGVRGLFRGQGTVENRHGRLVFIRLI